MKILFITDLYPIKEDEKTTPKTLLNFVKEWQKAGHEVDVIKPNFILNSFLRGKPFYKSGQYGNVYNINFWTPFLGNINHKYSHLWGRDREGANYSNQPSPQPSPTGEGINYDIIIAHMPSGILYADKLKVPFVAGIHNSDLEVLTNPLYKFHFRKRLKTALYNAKAIACRSYVIKDKLLKLFPEFENKTFVAPSGIDENIISENERNYSKLNVLTCANFIKRKNIDKLIEACRDNFALTIIGDGKLDKKLRKLDKNVTFTGRLTSGEVYEQMRQHDIFILPSTGETFGMVYLEAMSQGCITACTKGDGVSGIIKDGENGFLTEPTIDGIKEVLNRIKSLDKNTLNAIRTNSFNTIKELTSRACAENYLKQIFKIL